jgi:hypothetical protein
MLTPKELYYQYTSKPCENDIVFDEYNQAVGGDGRGTPYNLSELGNFLKQLKYPCYSIAPYASVEPSDQDPYGILNTGLNKLGLPFKFLERLDVEAFKEIQPDIKSGTSYAVRNACDIARSCRLFALNQELTWEHRGATEYLYHFGNNSLIRCLMMLGPDLVSENEAFERATSCGPLGCLPRALGGGWSCAPGEAPGSVKCIACGECTKEPDEIEPGEQSCCTAATCEQYGNWCCNDVSGERYSTWGYNGFPLKHVGLLIRKSYGGYANFLNSSGPNFYSCNDKLFLQYFQSINNYDYINNQVLNNSNSSSTNIDRMRTISIIDPTSPPYAVNRIKDLLYNGYGVVLMTNIGFPNSRDSGGLSYPDRIWYHSYAIIGYDDRKVDYDECVYLFANSWGNWNTGGHPKWGPIPNGSFLVTETHLKCMINLFRTDKKSCASRNQKIPCEDTSSCAPFECATRQKAMGMVFALSINEGFPKQELDYAQFYKVRELNKQFSPTLYFKATN